MASQSGPQHSSVEPLTGAQLTRQRLPDLRTNPNCTYTSSKAGTHFSGRLLPWLDFEHNVRPLYGHYSTSQYPAFNNKPISYRTRNAHEDPNKEQYACGNEIGVVGRIAQNVGHVMTIIAHDLGLNVCFGDWRAGEGKNNPNKIPDLAIFQASSDPTPRIVGEVKTPWTVPLSDIHEDQGQGTDFMQYVGQLASYMADKDLKYGFLTTYNDILFFKRDTQGGRRDLYMSNVILHSTESQRVQGSNPKDKHFQGIVSLRECMLYFCYLARDNSNDWRPENGSKIAPSAWVSAKPGGGLKEGQGHTMNLRNPKGGSGSSGGAGSSAAGGKVQSHGHGPGHNTGLSIDNPENDLKVKWDEQKRTYCYEKEPKVRGWVEDYKMENNQLLVKVNGTRRRAVAMDGPRLAKAGENLQKMAIRSR